MQVREITRLLNWAERTGRIEAAERNDWTAQLAAQPHVAATKLIYIEPTRLRTSPPPVTWMQILQASDEPAPPTTPPAPSTGDSDDYPHGWLAPGEQRRIEQAKERRRQR